MSTKSAETSEHVVLSKLDWIKQDADENAPIIFKTEKKLHTKIMESRYSPIGCFTAAGLLMYSLYTVKPEDGSKIAQVLTKYKAAAQGLTAAALLGGAWLTVMQLEKEKTEKTENKEKKQ